MRAGRSRAGGAGAEKMGDSRGGQAAARAGAAAHVPDPERGAFRRLREGP